jgi:hypothetical protein
VSRYIIVTGNPVDGFRFFGTANNATDANDAADRARATDTVDWWIAPLYEFGQLDD